jgi:glycerol-3-phosphate acyltransferase PlsX
MRRRIIIGSGSLSSEQRRGEKITMRIVLDAMGSDIHPEPEVRAAIEATRDSEDEIILVGPDQEIHTQLRRITKDYPMVRVVHAPEVLEMSDKPAENARRKTQNSMSVGMNLIKNGEADAFITAGNTGGAMATALFQLGRIRGIKRPALTALFPVKAGYCVVLDIGANADCKAEYLMQFAIMGSIYANKVMGIANPRVALLSNGEETGKGNELVKESYPLIQSSGLNFVGNVEAKELFGGEVDVVVADGFTGNILLKSSEAVAKLITELLREELTSSLRTKAGALLARPAFAGIKKMMDPAEVGAAPLLGVNGLVFIGHGRSDARALVNAIQVAKQAVNSDLLQALQTAIKDRLAQSNTRVAI